MSKRLSTVKCRVEFLLQNEPETRDNDMYLFLRYVENFSCWGASDHTFRFVMTNAKALKIPNFETVRRCRALLQSTNPAYAPSKAVAEMRVQEEENFTEFMRESK